MKLIKINVLDPKDSTQTRKALINPESIVSVQRTTDTKTTLIELLIHGQGRCLGVKETPEELIKLIQDTEEI